MNIIIKLIGVIMLVISSTSVNAALSSSEQIKPSEIMESFDVHACFNMDEVEKAEKLFKDFVTFLDSNNINHSSEFHPRIYERSPFTTPMFEVVILEQEGLSEKLGSVVSWMMFNRNGFSVLVHPNTKPRNKESMILDHSTYCLWMGTPKVINLSIWQEKQ